MSTNKRSLNTGESPTEKRIKIENNTNDLLCLDDAHLTEKDYQNVFQNIANQLINNHELVVNDEHIFRLCEIEFYYYHQTRHADTFAHRHPEQEYDANWYFHRQGNSPTASYKGGTYKGLDITFRSLTKSSFGGILIRSLKNKQTGQIYEGCCLVVDAILNLCTSKTITELVEIKLNQNLHIYNKNPFLYLRSIPSTTNRDLISSPRVGLTLKVPSIDRERFLFRPYRFTPTDYYPSKMKMTIVLALAAEKFFNGKKEKFIDYANDLSTQTNTRLSTLTANLKDLQLGYDMDTTKKKSPLIDFHKMTMKTADFAKAYGIWLRSYRSK